MCCSESRNQTTVRDYTGTALVTHKKPLQPCQLQSSEEPNTQEAAKGCQPHLCSDSSSHPVAVTGSSRLPPAFNQPAQSITHRLQLLPHSKAQESQLRGGTVYRDLYCSVAREKKKKSTPFGPYGQNAGDNV